MRHQLGGEEGSRCFGNIYYVLQMVLGPLPALFWSTLNPICICYPYFIDGQTEAQKNQMLFPRSKIECMEDPGFEAEFFFFFLPSSFLPSFFLSFKQITNSTMVLSLLYSQDLNKVICGMNESFTELRQCLYSALEAVEITLQGKVDHCGQCRWAGPKKTDSLPHILKKCPFLVMQWSVYQFLFSL